MGFVRNARKWRLNRTGKPVMNALPVNGTGTAGENQMALWRLNWPGETFGR